MNAHQIAFLQSMMSAPMTTLELADFESHHGEEKYLVIDERPREKRKLMLLFTACNGRVLRDYIQTYRPDVYEQYYLVQLYVHSLVVEYVWKKLDTFPWIIPALFNHCDVLVYNPIGSDYRQFSDQNVLRYLNHSAVALSYSGNYHGCWHAITPLFGEECVYRYLDEGLSEDNIWEKFTNGNFDCQFPKRFAHQMAWIKGRETGNDARLEKFISNHYKKVKCWDTFSHPTYNCNANIADQLLEGLGFKPMGDDHSISLPSDRCRVAAPYPESHYEFEHYGFEYKMTLQESHGGMSFFRQAISDARGRWIEKRKKS